MRDIKPGYWAAQGAAEILDARHYDRREFRDWSLESPIFGPWRASLPRPPAGPVVLAVSDREYSRRTLYRVEARALRGLESLRRIVRAAQLGNRVEWAAAQYGPNVVHSPLPPPLDRPVVSISAKPFARSVSKERPGKRNVRGHIGVTQRSRESPRLACELIRACVVAARHPSVASEVIGFVSRYGELVGDFGRWCAESGCVVTAGSPSSAPGVTNERLLWPQNWRRWSIGVYERFQQLGRDVHIPAPVAFYVWAALMLAALSDHPELPGSRLFLANRLASLRLIQSWDRMTDHLTQGKADHRKRATLRATGTLLDYLALSAAFRAWPIVEISCPTCGGLFLAEDRRKRYCSELCRKAGPARWARVYRDRLNAATRFEDGSQRCQ